MGDRGEIVISGPETNADGSQIAGPFEVYIYTHWGGSDLPVLAAAAIDKAEGSRRLSDLPYFARICVDVLSKHANAETRGVGVSNTHIDGGKAVHYRKRRSGSEYNISVELSGFGDTYPDIEDRQMSPAHFADVISDTIEGAP